jgi:gas vesicle protein
MATNKTQGKTRNTFDFSDSREAFKESAKTMNAQVKEVADELFDDILNTGDQLKDLTLEPVIEVFDKIADKITLENIRKTIKKVNQYTLKTAEELTEGVIENSEKWQSVTEKAVKGGLKLTAKQQVILFDTLETLKGQFSENTNRFRKIFF